MQYNFNDREVVKPDFLLRLKPTQGSLLGAFFFVPIRFERLVDRLPFDYITLCGLTGFNCKWLL